MKNKIRKFISIFLIDVVLVSVLVIAFNIVLNGMYLIGIPNEKDVAQIKIAYPSVTNEVKVYDDTEKIKLAVSLSGFLKYSVFDKSQDEEEPLMTMTYVLKNGEEVSVAANRNTVWWKGKTHVIKDKEVFINLAEGIFFLEDLAEI